MGLDRFHPATRAWFASAFAAPARPLDEMAGFVGGAHPVEVVDAREAKELEIEVVVPVDDMAALGGAAGDAIPSGSASGRVQPPTIWPHVEERVLELIRAHHSTIVFANSRRLAERLCARVNELAEEELARAHHGSVSREQRAQIEDDLKTGRLRAVVATSSLELGVDMGAVDLVIQIEAPDSVASGLQRIGRAGHQVGAVSRGIAFPKYRGDLLEAAVVVERMRAGAIESLRYPCNPLDVLAQQVVAMVAMDDWTVDALEAVVRRAAPARDRDTTRRSHAWAEQLLRRHGIVTRGAVMADRVAGGFAGVYPLLSAFEERGKCRRGYFVEGLGGAQFALPGAVDRLRALAGDDAAAERAVVLAATDPANPFGAALPWPERGAAEAGHRAGRKAGAVVVLVGGQLLLYVERGGKSVLSYGDDPAQLHAAVEALAAAVRSGILGRFEIERADGEPVRDTPLASALIAAGFGQTYKGLRLRA